MTRVTAVIEGTGIWCGKAKINCSDVGYLIAVVNLSGTDGKVETWLEADPYKIYNVISIDFMKDALFPYILFDPETDSVYAVQSMDLCFV